MNGTQSEGGSRDIYYMTFGVSRSETSALILSGSGHEKVVKHVAAFGVTRMKDLLLHARLGWTLHNPFFERSLQLSQISCLYELFNC